MSDLRDGIVDVSSSMIAYVMLNPEKIFLGALIALCVATLCILLGWKPPKKEGLTPMMGKRERKLYRAQEVADAVCDGLQAKYENGRLTRDEVNQEFKRIAHATGLWDLYPKRIVVYPKPEELKAKLLYSKAMREKAKAEQAKAPPAPPTAPPATPKKQTMREMLLGKNA